MRTVKLISISAMLLLTSCTNTLKVAKYENKKFNKKPGLPFFVQKPIVKKTTKYLYWWYEISVYQQKFDSKDVLIYFKKTKSNAPIYEKLINVESNDLRSIISIIKELPTELNKIPATSIADNCIVENSWKNEVSVDYQTRYYVNGKSPWLGKNNFSLKLHPNGTLNEVSSETENKVSEALTDILPIKDYLSSVLIHSEDSMALMNAGEIPFRIKIAKKGYVFTFIMYIDKSKFKESEHATTIPFDLKNGNYTRSDWPVINKKNSSEESNNPKIGISGTIKLPKK